MFFQIENSKKSDKKFLLDLNILDSESENRATKSLENPFFQAFHKEEEETKGKIISNNTSKFSKTFYCKMQYINIKQNI